MLFSKILNDFPSASAIEYDSGKLYVFGDDAPYLLIMDTAYRRLDTIRYSNDTAYRMDRMTKPDIESSALLSYNGEKFLYGLGSFANDNRKRLLYFPLANPRAFLNIDYAAFANRLKSLPELNIEGMAFVKSKMVLANRANKTHRVNKLIVTNSSLYDLKPSSQTSIIDLRFDLPAVIGVSGLFYCEEKDMLFFTASEEDTPSAIQDGTINDSYLGWIDSFSAKMSDSTIKPEHLIKLSGISPVFSKQKIEAVCVESIDGRHLVLDLASDNDKGQSGLYKVKLTY